jgi:hypothetical protein
MNIEYLAHCRFSFLRRHTDPSSARRWRTVVKLHRHAPSTSSRIPLVPPIYGKKASACRSPVISSTRPDGSQRAPENGCTRKTAEVALIAEFDASEAQQFGRGCMFLTPDRYRASGKLQGCINSNLGTAVHPRIRKNGFQFPKRHQAST